MNDVALILILILGGLALIVGEVCIPSFGVLTAAALACFAWAVYTCFTLSGVLGVVVVVALLIGLPIYLSVMVKVLPNTPLGRRLALKKLKGARGTGVPESPDHQELIGAEGVATTLLRPSGTITVGDRRLSATAESGYLRAGTKVRIVRTTGLNVVVRAVQEPSDSDSHA